MSYRFKGQIVIINGVRQVIQPSPLPSSPEDGLYAIDITDGKLKVYNESKSRWIVLGDAEDVYFNNSNNDFNSTNTQNAIEEARDTNIGKIFSFNFYYDSIAWNDWLIYHNSLATSDEVPAVIPFKCKLISVTFSNEDHGVDCDIYIQKSNETNGNSDSTALILPLREVRTARLSDFSETIFEAGDKIAIYLADQGTNADEPVVNLYFKILEDNTENVSENWSGDF